MALAVSYEKPTPAKQHVAWPPSQWCSMAFHGHGWPRPCVCVSLYYFVPSAQPNMVDHGSQPWKLAMPRDLHVPTEASRPIIDGNVLSISVTLSISDEPGQAPCHISYWAGATTHSIKH
ncbi:hypothetical protein BDR06DRAFT_960436 [Suillus hirtellus]|nr:hypothetical protein BDR06DRAFT_960436 [Suillus hirtellus]